MGYARKVITGISWMSGLQVAIRILSLIKIAFLARLLSPSQFGIFGIAALVLSFFELITETGINVVLIQSKKEIDSYINSAWVVSIVRGTIISLVILFLSPFIASFFNASEAVGVLLFISLVPFVRGFINPAVVRFQKELTFHLEFYFRTLLFLVDATIALVVAFITHSAVSLVWGLLASALLEVILSFILIKTLPRFVVEREFFGEIFHKGKWVTLYGVFDYFAKNGDNIVVGKMLGVTSLGMYQAAYRIATLTFTEITEVVNKVFFPVFVKISEESEKLKKVFIRSFLMLALVIIPLSLIIIIFSKEIVLLFLGEQWIEAAAILPILALYGMLRSLVGYPAAILLALHKQQDVAFMAFVRACVLGITIIPLIYMFGIVGAAYAAILSVIVEAPVVLYILISTFRRQR